MKESVENFRDQIENMISNLTDQGLDYLNNSENCIEHKLLVEKKLQGALRALNSALKKFNQLDSEL